MNRWVAIATLILGLALALSLAVCAPQPDGTGSPATPDRPALPGETLPLPPPIVGPTARTDADPFPKDCAEPTRYRAAAAENRNTLDLIAWSPFGRPERGWRTYAPFVAFTVDSGCPPDSPRFAEALAAWSARNGLRADGVLTPDAFVRMKNAAHAARPFVSTRARGVCPDAPDERELVTAGPTEGYRGKAVRMRPAVLAAYRRMVADARRDLPELARDPDMLDIFSAYRSPAYDAARCERDGNCQGVTRAKCSPHRTGLAIDIVVGNAPGHPVDSSADVNRLHMAQTPAYQWLVRNARRYGFVNYVFEPWHWEYVEEPI